MYETNDGHTIASNLIEIKVDPTKVEIWETELLQTFNIEYWLMIFARYAYRNGSLISVDLPDDPVDELTEEQAEKIKSSKAYKELRRLGLDKLKVLTAQFSAGVKGFLTNG